MEYKIDGFMINTTFQFYKIVICDMPSNEENHAITKLASSEVCSDQSSMVRIPTSDKWLPTKLLGR